MQNEADDFVVSGKWKAPDPLDKYLATVSIRPKADLKLIPQWRDCSKHSRSSMRYLGTAGTFNLDRRAFSSLSSTISTYR